MLNSNVGTAAVNHTEHAPFSLPSTNYSCQACQISFPNGQEQRIHMKEPWHVYNIKRRIASLPPVPCDAINVQPGKPINKSDTSNTTRSASSRSTTSSDEDGSDDEDEQTASPFQCLFCNRGFPQADDGFAANLEHMRTTHGLSIPDLDLVSDLQSFVGYLATEVRIWHECLYCGAMKDSTQSIQSHMRDKGHCILNFDREPELLDFWERIDETSSPTLDQEEGLTYLSKTEIRSASDRVIGSRHATPAIRKTSRKRSPTASKRTALPPNSEDAEPPPLTDGPQLASGRQLARREEMSIVGISFQQRQALVLAEKKAQRSEAVARRAREWVNAKGANSQKFDQVDNQMKWGKQNHKLQPR